MGNMAPFAQDVTQLPRQTYPGDLRQHVQAYQRLRSPLPLQDLQDRLSRGDKEIAAEA